jgi:hypothetical protein
MSIALSNAARTGVHWKANATSPLSEKASMKAIMDHPMI